LQCNYRSHENGDYRHNTKRINTQALELNQKLFPESPRLVRPAENLKHQNKITAKMPEHTGLIIYANLTTFSLGL
jgi:hypothetical protein